MRYTKLMFALTTTLLLLLASACSVGEREEFDASDYCRNGEIDAERSLEEERCVYVDEDVEEDEEVSQDPTATPAPVEEEEDEDQAQTNPNPTPDIDEDEEDVVPSEGNNVDFSTDCDGKDVGAVQELIGLSVVCLGTEYDAYTWRSIPIAVDATVPDGWIATLHLSEDDRVIVTQTPGKYSIEGGTFRRKSGYPASDAVHEPCELLTKEQAFGASQTPSFPVYAHGFECTGAETVQVNTDHQEDGEPSSPPPSDEPSGDLMSRVEGVFDGNIPGSLELIEEDTAVKYNGECVSLDIPNDLIVDVWDGSSASVASGNHAPTVCEATFRNN